MRPPPVYVTLSNWRNVEPGAIVIDYKRATIWRDGLKTASSLGRISKRFRIVTTLISSTTGFLSYDELYESVWGDDPSGGPCCSLDASYYGGAVSSLHIKLPDGSEKSVSDWLGFCPHFHSGLRMVDVGWGKTRHDWRVMRKASKC